MAASLLVRAPLVAVLALALAAVAARAQEAPVVGRAALVQNDVRGQVAGGAARRMVVEDDILFQEVIQAGDDARALVEFRDGSTLDIGPGALVTIDRFLFNPAEGRSERAVSVVRGVFRYISGASLPGQQLRIATPAGTVGIRGSVVLGAVGDDIPTFLHVAQGNARFENAAGAVELGDDQSIAVGAVNAAPPAPADLPPALAAESLGAIERRLLPADQLRARRPADERRLRRDGELSLVPAADQLARQGGATPLAARGPSGIAGDVPLLRRAGQLGLLGPRSGAPTAEQQGFLQSLRGRNEGARRAIRAFGERHRGLYRFNTERGVAHVMDGVGRAASNEDVLAAAAGNTARAHPGLGPAITRSALAGYRGPDRAGTARAVAARVAGRAPVTPRTAAGGRGAAPAAAVQPAATPAERRSERRRERRERRAPDDPTPAR
jgi:hypothetical protein